MLKVNEYGKFSSASLQVSGIRLIGWKSVKCSEFKYGLGSFFRLFPSDMADFIMSEM